MWVILAARRAALAFNKVQGNAVKFHRRTLPPAASRSIHSAQSQRQAVAATATKEEDPTERVHSLREFELSQKVGRTTRHRPAIDDQVAPSATSIVPTSQQYTTDQFQFSFLSASKEEPDQYPPSLQLPDSPAAASPFSVAALDHSRLQQDQAKYDIAIGNKSENEVLQTSDALPATIAEAEEPLYWQKISRWKDVPMEVFLTHKFQVSKTIQKKHRLIKFLSEVLPEKIPASAQHEHIRTSDDFILDVMQGIDAAPMEIRLTPHMLSVIDWNNPLEDPIRRQFIPMKSSLVPDHPKLEFDSLHETKDSPVEGLVHRYPDKVLFLVTDVCPHYCRYCTRSYAIGGNTETVTKLSYKPVQQKWQECIDYISNTSAVTDVVVSGGDCYLITPDQIRWLGEKLLAIPHVKRFRFATKGIAVNPCRILDEADTWTDEVIRLSWNGRRVGKSVAIHTHFNHPVEMTWVSRKAAQKLFENGVVVRNQTVLLKGVNDDVETMSKLIRQLADSNIQPYYVYQQDMVKGVDDLRTPLQTILDLECQIRGTIAGFMTPNFIVDLPGGGGKRLASSYQTYDRTTGRSTFIAPAVTGRGKENMTYEYWDPIPSLPKWQEQPVVQVIRDGICRKFGQFSDTCRKFLA